MSTVEYEPEDSEWDDPDWIPPLEVGATDLLDNTKAWGPVFFYHGSCQWWEPILFPCIIREITRPWRRGVGLQVHWWNSHKITGFGKKENRTIVARGQALALGIWWKGDGPADLREDFDPASGAKLGKIASWRRGKK